MKGKFYVYALLDTRKGKKGRVFYIGKGKGRRSQDHLRDTLDGSHRNRKLSNKIQKIHQSGLKYGVEFLFSSDNETECFDREIYWIQFYGRNTLCNLTDGGEGVSGRVYNKQFRDKMSKALKGEGNPFWGKRHSDETKNKIRSFRTGLLASTETKLKMSVARKGKPHPQDPGKIAESRRARAISGAYTHVTLICLDGVIDTVEATCRRIEIDVKAFRKIKKEGILSDQDIADRMRQRVGKGHRLFSLYKNKSGFVGVRKSRTGPNWNAGIVVNRQYKHLGTHADILDAAKAYNIAALEYFGSNAYQNHIPNLDH